MLNLEELEQFVAFADAGTLSQVAEKFHISTPSVTRAMQNVEREFDVPLFKRTKNRIELSETGLVAVEYARKLLDEAGYAVAKVRDYDARRNTITVRSCAPAPLWRLLVQLNARYPDSTVVSGICSNEQTEAALTDGECDIAILPYKLDGYVSKEYMKEHLFVCVPRDHELAGHSELSFKDINGFNFLLRTELGFWDALCRERMPSSRFMVQSDDFAMSELVRTSSLPCFATDAVVHDMIPRIESRVMIPMTDPEVNVTFYLISRSGDII